MCQSIPLGNIHILAQFLTWYRTWKSIRYGDLLRNLSKWSHYLPKKCHLIPKINWSIPDILALILISFYCVLNVYTHIPTPYAPIFISKGCFLSSKDFSLKKPLDDSLCFFHHTPSEMSVRLSFDDIICFVLCASGQNLNKARENFVIKV